MLTKGDTGRWAARLLLPAIIACAAAPASRVSAQDLQPLDAPDPFAIRNEALPRFARPGVAQQLAPLDRLPADAAAPPTAAFTRPEPVQQAQGRNEPASVTGSTDKGRQQAATVSQGGKAVAARKVGHGRATFYEHNGRTASGERYKPDGLTAAHHSLPLGSRVRVVNEENGKSVEVRINDRTNQATNAKRPYVIDLSRGAARALDIEDTGSVDIYKAP
jgi:rare lipoprotein A (peptidoglycan hydrolase)